MDNFFFKVQPTRTFVDEVGISRTVVGIHALIVNNIPVNVSPTTNFSFFIKFLLATGVEFGQRNVETSEFVSQAVDAGYPIEQAQSNMMQIMQGLIFGNESQKYAAAGALAGLYGYSLAPIGEQNGNPLAQPETPSEPEPQPE